jgi:hypothetical protein
MLFTIIVALLVLISIAAVIILLLLNQINYILVAGLLIIDVGLIFSLCRIIVQYHRFKK